MLKPLISIIALVISVSSGSGADRTASSLLDRAAVLTVAARSINVPKTKAPVEYGLEWQRRLLAFQLAYAAELGAASLIDPTETGSITVDR